MHFLCSASGKFDYLSARHFRAARALLAWSQSELADRAHVVRRTIVMLESGGRRTQPRNVQAVLDAYLAAGIRFSCNEEGDVSVIDATSRVS
ncbi:MULTISPECIES: helix-turn-helix domain-containing protein [unclassified Methylobacterium]